MRFFKKLRRDWLADHLINSVRRLEDISVKDKRWDATPEILGSLIKLLQLHYKYVIDEDVIQRLHDAEIVTQFENLRALDIYFNEFIVQTGPFVRGEINSKPKIESSLSTTSYLRDSYREMSPLDFLEVADKVNLERALKRLVELSQRLNTHLKQASDARRQILIKMMKDEILPAYTVIEKIYEVLNDVEAKAD